MKELETGTVVDGRYSIESPIGRGGFAAVYKAHHQRLNKSVALKVLDLPDVPMDVQPFVARFMREAQVSARIEHANIVTVYDYGVIETTSQPFIAMEYLRGHDLQDELQDNGPLEFNRLIKLFAPALDALGAAHTAGVVHKDLKPSNLFLVHEGTPRERLVVLDFGIARFYTEEESRLTQTGGFSGTPAYLAPEYIERQEVSPALDVYQMGLILLEALTGETTVKADNPMAYMLAHCSGNITIPPNIAATEFGKVIQKAISRDPKARFQDAHVFADALRGTTESDTFPVIANRPQMITHGPVEVPVEAEEQEESFRGFAAMVGVLVVAITVASLYLAYRYASPGVEETTVEITEAPPTTVEKPADLVKTVEIANVEKKPETETPIAMNLIEVQAQPRAKVFINGKLIGFSPQNYEFKEGEEIEVRLEARNYESFTKTVISSTKIIEELRKKGRTKRKPRTTKKTEKKPPDRKVKPVGIVN